MCRLIFCPNLGFIQHWEQHIQDADLDCFPRKKNKLQALGQCAQEFVKKIGNLFQHWENPGFIQDWEQHVQDADFEEKHKLHALDQ